jgi:hypothetical protein
MELIGMSDYVLQQGLHSSLMLERGMILCNRYANFLKMNLELWMFIPCDNEGNVLINPIENKQWSLWKDSERSKICDEYQEAKDRVIFEDCDFEKFKYVYIINFNKVGKCITTNSKTNKTIEDLTSLGLTITPQAIKKYNLT